MEYLRPYPNLQNKKHPTERHIFTCTKISPTQKFSGFYWVFFFNYLKWLFFATQVALSDYYGKLLKQKYFRIRECVLSRRVTLRSKTYVLFGMWPLLMLNGNLELCLASQLPVFQPCDKLCITILEEMR